MSDLASRTNAVLAGVLYPVIGVAGGLVGEATTVREILAREPSAVLIAAGGLLDRVHGVVTALAPLHALWPF
jgi:predicted CDP-diglyceride synthetase/phosphatidate cytidylyltransferase